MLDVYMRHRVVAPIWRVFVVLILAVGIVGFWGTAAAQTSLTPMTDAEGNVLFHVPDEGGLLAPGTFGASGIPAEGPGTRLLWHSGKGAFRAGRVGFSVSDGTEWNDENVGPYSVAFGVDTKASGRGSVAWGQGTTAKGDQSLSGGTGPPPTGYAPSPLATLRRRMVISRRHSVFIRLLSPQPLSQLGDGTSSVGPRPPGAIRIRCWRLETGPVRSVARTPSCFEKTGISQFRGA